MPRPRSHSKRILFWFAQRQAVTCFRFLLQRRAFASLVSLAAFYLITLWLETWIVMPQETYSVADSFIGLPSQCFTVAKRLNTCQLSSPSVSVVFACHQRWCNGWGHCGLCSGIGDRSRNLMSLIQDAFDRCVSFQIDAPQTGLAMREDVVYHDRWGVVAELFHFRSYDATNHTVNVDEWSHHHVENKKHRSIRRTRPIFVHMTPDNHPPNVYDPCLFHILFRPSQNIQKQLSSYMSTIYAHSKNVIGIHLRSGDLPAFGLKDYKDARVSNVENALDKMIQCGQKLTQRLFASGSKAAFFVATDHRVAKELAKRKFAKNDITIFTTDIIPQNYQRHEGDAHAWLELFILSKMRGLVTNTVPKGYIGTAGNFSYFALLAANLGFMNDTQLFPCSI